MHIRRRIARGSLSEIAGSGTLQSDIFFHNLRLYRTAKVQADNLGAFERELLAAYVFGINSYVENLWILPLEFWFISDSFDKWTIEDSILTY